MEGVITRAFVIRTGANSYVGRFDDAVKLISANIYACKTSANRYLKGNGDRVVAINIELEKERGGL